MKNEAEKFLDGWEWLGSQLRDYEPKTNRLLKQRFKCLQARDTAHDPEFKFVWNNHAEALRIKLKKELN
jgi:hypothetical protein